MAMVISRRLLIITIVLSALPGCIEPQLRPYVDVQGLVAAVTVPPALSEEGTAEDQYQQGVKYQRAIPPDYKEAVRWYRLAAMQRHPEALFKLCVLSEAGRGLPQDYQESLRWCRLAADQEHARAMYTLGIHYQDARGVAKDLVQAHLWYNLASAHGDEAGAKWRDRLVTGMTPAQITQAQFLARNWRPNTQERNTVP
jgi:uncharacterized protein